MEQKKFLIPLLKKKFRSPIEIKMIDTPIDELMFMKMIHKRHLLDNLPNIHCLYCEAEKIQSRFEILDL